MKIKKYIIWQKPGYETTETVDQGKIIMQAIRQIIDTQKLKNLIDIPEGFSSEKVEVIVFPVLTTEKEKTQRNIFSQAIAAYELNESMAAISVLIMP